jgi:predicted permease
VCLVDTSSIIYLLLLSSILFFYLLSSSSIFNPLRISPSPISFNVPGDRLWALGRRNLLAPNS